MPSDDTFEPCPRASSWGGKQTSCKSPMCPVCGPRWARDQLRRLEINLDAYNGPVVLVSLTPPGADQGLPWDEAHCAGRHHGGAHAGKRGCRVQQRAAREWMDTLTWRWGQLRKRCRIFAIRHSGEAPRLLGTAWEPQRRGVPHLHFVLGAATEAEREAARVFLAKLDADRTDFHFGFVNPSPRRPAGMSREQWQGLDVLERADHVHLEPKTAEKAARYLASYLAGRSKHKPSMREALAEPSMTYFAGRVCSGSKTTWRRSLVWLSTSLTRRTLLTMRTLRRARHLWAAVKGFCPLPVWTGFEEGLKVGSVYRTVYLHRGPPIVTTEELAWAKWADKRMRWTDRQDWGLAGVRYAIGAAPEQLAAAA